MSKTIRLPGPKRAIRHPIGNSGSPSVRATSTCTCFLLLLLILFLFLAAVAVQAQPQDQQSEISQFGKYKVAKEELIVGFKKGVSENRKSSVHGSVNAKVKKRFAFINADLVKLPKGEKLEKAIEKYKKKDIVAYAEPNYLISIDRTLSPPITPNDPSFDDLWGLHNTGQSGGTEDADIDAPEAWDITTGSDSVVVAVIDTGVDYNHEDLAANMWVNEDELNGDPDVDDDGNGFVDDIYGYDFCTYGQSRDSDPMDDRGHGTHCAGTIGARGGNSTGVVGVNHVVKIMALKFLGSGGTGWTSDAVDCIDYARQMGAHVINNSWGGGSYMQSLKDAIEAFDGVVACAAGNDYVDTDSNPHYPSSYDSANIISVTAVDRIDDQYYNWGATSVDIGAPGRSILSTLPVNEYGWANGTSMATPHVAGVAALLKARYPTLTTSQIIEYIYAGVVHIDSLVDLCTTGGRLNAYNALDAAAAAVGSLRVDIEPAAAVTAGAQWRRVGTSTWLNSGDTETGILIGLVTVEYKDITGWDKPADEEVTIISNLTTTTTGTYTQTGSLQVTIEPQDAIDAGAQWRRTGTEDWRDSEYIEEGILVGDVTVEYKTIAGWNSPPDETVTINFHETTTTTGAYEQHTGSLKANITPQGAVDDGAKWRRVGTETWLDNLYEESDIPIGEVTVEFKAIPAWIKPANHTTTINYNQTTNFYVGYTANPLVLDASDGAGMPGNNVVITVSLNGGEGVLSFGFDLNFDPEFLEYQAPAAQGTLLPPGYTFDASLIGGNAVRITGSSGDGETTLNSGSGTLASITFKIKETAETGAFTDLTLSNCTGDVASATADNGQVEVIDCIDNYDVNMDGTVTPGDALLAFQHYLEIVTILDPCSLLRADANGDGNVTPGDALIIFREYLGLN